MHITVNVHIANVPILIETSIWTKNDGRRAAERHHDEVERGHVPTSHPNQPLRCDTEAATHHPVAEMILEEFPSRIGLNESCGGNIPRKIFVHWQTRHLLADQGSEDMIAEVMPRLWLILLLWYLTET